MRISRVVEQLQDLAGLLVQAIQSPPATDPERASGVPNNRRDAIVTQRGPAQAVRDVMAKASLRAEGIGSSMPVEPPKPGADPERPVGVLMNGRDIVLAQTGGIFPVVSEAAKGIARRVVERQPSFEGSDPESSVASGSLHR